MSARPTKSQADSLVSFDHQVGPEDLNLQGSLFGGTLMAWLDQAAGLCARNFSEGKVVTKKATDIYFHKPAFVGDKVHVEAYVSSVGNSSLLIHTKAYLVQEEPSLMAEGDFLQVHVDIVDRQFSPKQVPFELSSEDA